jgi:vacuolar protein sorting-associated protein 33A
VQLPASLVTPQSNNPPSNTTASSSSGAGTLPTVSVAKEQKKKYHLSTATDPLLEELRDVHFGNVGKRLNKTARRLNEEFKVTFNKSGIVITPNITFAPIQARNQVKTIAQIKDLVGKLGGLQSEHHALSVRMS